MECKCGGQTIDRTKQIAKEKFDYSECQSCGRVYLCDRVRDLLIAAACRHETDRLATSTAKNEKR